MRNYCGKVFAETVEWGVKCGGEGGPNQRDVPNIQLRAVSAHTEVGTC